jgi:threonine synthase
MTRIQESAMTHLECTRCGKTYDSERLWRLSPCCERPLYPRYDLAAIATRFQPAALVGRQPTLWRYAEVLPVRNPACRLTLGEGFTPLLDAPRLAAALGVGRIWVKDEGQNPTGSFKARGLAVAVARAVELGVREVAIPSAGNAGSATAAYAAAAGITAHVVLPNDTPRVIVEEIRELGADLELIAGLITDAGARVAEGAKAHGWFDLSTLKEPYRVEGKKTMAYELHEQLDGELPDVIVYPTGGGTGLVGMWKAWGEMRALGWPLPRVPRLVSVQAAGCAPVVRAFVDGAQKTEPFPNPSTRAWGLRVPSPIGGFLCLRALRETHGTAVAVDEASIAPAAAWLSAASGVDVCPEGGAAWAAVEELRASGWIEPDARVVVFNTGTGLKYR